MKILTACEMRAADEATFNDLGIPSRAVMEAAGRHLGEFLIRKFRDQLQQGVLILTGPGNNGGDGFVLGHALFSLGVQVCIFALKDISGLRDDAFNAAKVYQGAGGQLVQADTTSWEQQTSQLKAEKFGLLVDAILGTGAKGALQGVYAQGVDFINSFAQSTGATVISVDIPSGVDADTGAVANAVVAADCTCSLAMPKFGQLVSPGSEKCGQLHVLNIGVSESRVIQGKPAEVITSSLVAEFLANSSMRIPTSHKGSRGHVLVIGGSRGKYGAPKLSALAALKSGAGLVTVLCPRGEWEKCEPHSEELMYVVADEESGEFSSLDASFLAEVLKGKDVIVVGPGMGTGKGSKALLEIVFAAAQDLHLPLVIDADALNICSRDKSLLSALPSGAIMTPHPGEMARMRGVSIEEIQRERMAFARGSAENGAICVLKGARTVIASPEKVFLNLAETAVLGTAGSGDALAGLIGALVAQGLAREMAAVVGVYVHGIAGMAIETRHGGSFGALAGDILHEIPVILNCLLRFEKKLSFSQQIIPDPFVEFVLESSL